MVMLSLGQSAAQRPQPLHRALSTVGSFSSLTSKAPYGQFLEQSPQREQVERSTSATMPSASTYPRVIGIEARMAAPSASSRTSSNALGERAEPAR